MPNPSSLIDRIFYSNRREYTVREGNVAYLDGSPLSRPLSMPVPQRVVVVILVAAAVVIGAIIVNNTVLASMRQTADARLNVEQNLARPASIDTIPAMADLVNLTDDEIRATFESQGYTVFDATSLGSSAAMVLYKLPSDVSLDDAAVMYARGIGSLDAAQASRLLNGSWYFAVDRVNGTSMVVRYADFSTGDPQIAVQNAIAKEGFDPLGITESGVDDSGNTYSMGTLDADGTICTWKVSALLLEDMYSISGLPEEACYVGVRVTC